MKTDPRISEIDAIARIQRIPGTTRRDAWYPLESWHMLVVPTGFRNYSELLTKILVPIPKEALLAEVRAIVQHEAARELCLDPERVFVIVIPEDLSYD